MKIIYCIALTAFVSSLYGQDPTRFESEIERLLSSESVIDPNKELVVFTGSSSIKKWETVEAEFSQYNVLNYGFGGSQFSDLAYFYDSLIRNPAPDILFIYEGDNDIASGKEPTQVFQKAKSLLEKIRKDLPQTKVALIAPKPCIKNWGKRANYIKLNAKLESYCDAHDNLDFIDVWNLMVDENGIVFQDIFIADGDHMNAKGYKIWLGAVGEFLSEKAQGQDEIRGQESISGQTTSSGR